MRSEGINNKQKKIRQKVGSLFVIIILVYSGIFIIIPPNSKISTADEAPSSTDRVDNDFNNGTFDNVTLIGNGLDAELRLIAIELNEWTEKTPPINPIGRQFHDLAPIWGTDKILLFGGTNGTMVFNDTWIYNLSENKWTNKIPNNHPSARCYHAIASIWGTDKVVLMGGSYNGLGNDFGDTWIYDFSNNTWANVTTQSNPGFITQHFMAPVFGDDKVVLYGGSGPKNETWVYDYSINTWTLMKPTNIPPRKAGHSMVSIWSTDKVLLFGWLNFGGIVNETWVYDLSDNNWTRMADGPTGRLQHDIASIYGTDKVVLFGGFDWSVGENNDTWIFDLSENSWTQIFPKNNPEKRLSHLMASVWGTDQVILFSGAHGAFFNDTWVFNSFEYVDTGIFTSSAYNTSPNSSLKTISWMANLSTNTSVKFQLRTAETETTMNSKDFVGPDGSSASYYTSTPTNIWTGHNDDRWIQYKAYLSTKNSEETPRLRNVTITYNYWPNTTLVSPVNDSIINNNRPIFEWNFTDSDSTNQSAFQVLIDDDIEFQSIDYISIDQNSSNLTWEFPKGTSYTEITDGIWYWKVRTKDSDGDWSLYSQPWMIRIDTIAPNSIITVPVNEFYNNLDIISGMASDSLDGTGLNKVEIAIHRLNDDSYWTGQKWVDSESWLKTYGTKKWTYDISSVIWHSGFKYNIQSRAIDNATNIEIPKASKNITMDFDNVTFSNAFPSFADVSPTEELEVGITISDTISGVNASTIEYLISEDEGKTWTTWKPVTGLESGKTINVTLNINFLNGTGNRIKWRASDIAGNGPKESKVYVVIVNTWLMELSIPKVKLWSPPNGSIISSTALELSWRLTNKDLLNVTYDVYLDTVNPPVKINHSGIINTTVIIDNLSNGVTYYWTVISKTEKINGSCESGVWSFTIIIPIPKVNLISPENNSIINDFQPGLSWSVEYDGTEIITYDIYFGTSEDPELEFKDHPSTNCFIKERLTEGETYFWKVEPWAGDYLGSVSETWSFTVKKDYIPHFELELFILPPVVELPPGNIKQVKAIVSNLGELEDSILLRIEVPPDSGVGANVDEPSVISVIPHAIAEFNILVTTSMDAPNEEVILTVIASSRRAPEFELIVEEEAELTVKILNREKTDEDNPWLSLSAFWIIFLIIIIILIVLIIVWMVLKQKKTSLETKDKSTPEDAETVKPGTVPEVEISVGKAPPTGISPQLPGISTTAESEKPTSQIVKVPTLASSTTPGQIPETQQIPQVTQVPQLPSAQPETAETKEESAEETTPESDQSIDSNQETDQSSQEKD